MKTWIARIAALSLLVGLLAVPAAAEPDSPVVGPTNPPIAEKEEGLIITEDEDLMDAEIPAIIVNDDDDLLSEDNTAPESVAVKSELELFKTAAAGDGNYAAAGITPDKYNAAYVVYTKPNTVARQRNITSAKMKIPLADVTNIPNGTKGKVTVRDPETGKLTICEVVYITELDEDGNLITYATYTGPFGATMFFVEK